MSIKTADLYDEYPSEVRVAEPLFQTYGAAVAFGGPVSTVKVEDDNVLVRQALEEPGEGRVLVVDGAGSLRCALIGDRLAQLAYDNDWAGIIVYGCIRDSREMASIPLGVKALQTNPAKSAKRGIGEREVMVTFAGVVFLPGYYVYADEDGILVAERELVPIAYSNTSDEA